MQAQPNLCRPFNKVLVANRGEIALRVMRTCKALGYTTVAVYSEADASSPHVKFACEAVLIGKAPSNESYLSIPALIDACKKSGADAVHPGYGFLSENADFADACAQSNIVFIGPSGETMRALGNKAAAKELLSAYCPRVPLIPGYDVGQDAEHVPSSEKFLTEANKIGYPLLCKAASGGGGRGLRIIRKPEDLLSGMQEAMSEAKSSFADARILLERYFDESHHIEFQILGDKTGTVIELGERECSVQRRYQKVIEESPSPFIFATLRSRMAKAACEVGRSCNYLGAGTVEFLVDASGENFYFLEVNTRLQVEHPITELTHANAIPGLHMLDLVAVQLKIASGMTLAELGLRSDQERICKKGSSAIPTTGHAIECRLYAEDPVRDFFPSVGRVISFYAPGLFGAEPQEGVRIDTGIESGSNVTVYYDPLLAKVITHGSTREEARKRMVKALNTIVVFGLATNKTYLIHALEADAFKNGHYSTSFIQEHMSTEMFSRNLSQVLLQPTSSNGANSTTPKQMNSICAWQELQIAALVASILARRIQFEQQTIIPVRGSVPTGWNIAPISKRFNRERFATPYLDQVKDVLSTATSAKDMGNATGEAKLDVNDILQVLDAEDRAKRYQPPKDVEGDYQNVWYQIQQRSSEFVLEKPDNQVEFELHIKFEDTESMRQAELCLSKDLKKPIKDLRSNKSAMLGSDEKPLSVVLHHFSALTSSRPGTHEQNETILSLTKADPVMLDISIGGVRKRFLSAFDESIIDWDEDDSLPIWVQHAHPLVGSLELIRASRFDPEGCIQLKAMMLRNELSSSAGSDPNAKAEIEIFAPMPCKVVKLMQDSGAAVKKKDVVIIVESMKMEMRLDTKTDGVIEFCVAPGDVVKQGAKLAIVRRSP